MIDTGDPKRTESKVDGSASPCDNKEGFSGGVAERDRDEPFTLTPIFVHERTMVVLRSIQLAETS
ncbi:MAG: hypothetical protein ACYCPT_07870 [Acidimicrobiales bacterium]